MTKNIDESIERFLELLRRYEEHIIVIESIISNTQKINTENEHFLYCLEKETSKLYTCRKEIEIIKKELKDNGIEINESR